MIEPEPDALLEPVAEALSEELLVVGFRMDERMDERGSPPPVLEDEAAELVTEPDDAEPLPVIEPESVEEEPLAETVVEPLIEELTESVAVLVTVAEPEPESVADEEELAEEGSKIDDKKQPRGSQVELEEAESVVLLAAEVGVSVMVKEAEDVADKDEESVALAVDAVVESVAVAETEPEMVDEMVEEPVVDADEDAIDDADNEPEAEADEESVADEDDESVDAAELAVADDEMVVELAGTKDVVGLGSPPRPPITFPRLPPASPNVSPRSWLRPPTVCPRPPGKSG